jgi:hypothetical protein
VTTTYRGDNGMFITHPGFGKTFHIFDTENRSLCGKVMMLRVDPIKATPLLGDEVYSKGTDCKACFRKAGLKLEEIA